MDIYRQLFGRIMYPAWETGLRRRPTLRHLAYLQGTQWLPLAKLEELQFQATARLLSHAYAHVPYYRGQFEKAGIHPQDIRCVADLTRLPILDRDEARDTVVARTATAGASVDIQKQTSGSTGRPLVFGYERESDYWRQAMKLRGYGWAGCHPGIRSLYFWGAGPPPAGGKATIASRLKTSKVKLDRALRREHYIDCGRRGPAELAGVVETIRREKPEVIVCYAQAGVDLAHHVVDHGLRDWGTIPVICGAERLSPGDRGILELAFGTAVFETYGCREVMLIATDCEAHKGMHTSMETLVVEVVVRDGKGGARPAQPGETGEVVITDLTNLAMPFIRYANGDLATLAESGVCPCGRAHPRLASVDGRVAETLTDGTGARVNGLVFNVVIAHIAGAIRQFQAVQHRDRSVTLRVVPSPSYSDHTEGTLRQTWERYLPGVPVTIDLVSEIPTTATGKRQVVIVER
jgi:phenylacetate-CoA ligase